MKALPFKIPKVPGDVLLFQNDRNKVPYSQLHQHEEYQITLIEKGNGNMIVGDSFRTFRPGDIFFFGPHLSHVFLDDEKCSMISIFFTEKSLGDNFFELSQMEELKTLFSDGDKGLRIDSSRNRIKELMHACEHNKGVHLIISFLQLLQSISKSDVISLSTFSYKKHYSYNEGKRMMAVFDFVMTNYNRDISLDQISKIAHLTRTAFCKYFKQRTNKTFFQFLIEVRLEKSCELLVNKMDMSVEDIAFQCGFNNLSNFNRQFKALRGLTPTRFKNSRKGLIKEMW